MILTTTQKTITKNVANKAISYETLTVGITKTVTQPSAIKDRDL